MILSTFGALSEARMKQQYLPGVVSVLFIANEEHIQ
jgi:hypothetical protein